MRLIILATTALATIAAAPEYPVGKLPDTVRPTAYRLDLVVDPAKPGFTGHSEIDAVLARPSSTIFLHGLGLKVGSATVSAGGRSVAATYSEVDPTGVARLDLKGSLPAGKVTFKFDYAAEYRTGAEGLFHAEVAGDWYAWTQMEPIDARRMFPGFDEPGFKTPFTVTLTVPTGQKAFANAPELSAKPAGAMTVHRFAATKPLPTYLVAVGVGPFDVVTTRVPANAVRKTPLAFRVIATKGQLPRMQFAAREAPKLLTGLETYFGIPYPYEKLDYLASPIQGGAMENAGLIIYQDTLILLDENAPFSQLRGFGEVTAHEMAHQWFGDLVTPTWWTDIWLNESFAEWMGKKVGDAWRPDLGIAASELDDAFDAMDTDSLGRGRPIRQTIEHNDQIVSAFDGITYRKGAQVVSMFENYVGAETFRKGVRLHLNRYRYANASADDFFRSVGEAANNAKVVPAMRTFTDQTGVPLLTARDGADGVALTQSRYRPLGVAAKADQTWSVPLCLGRDAARACSLLETASATVPGPAGTGPLLPNAAGGGYYRFSLDDAGWDRLIAAAPTAPGRDAMAVADSIWADFVAGRVSFARVVAAATALSGNSERLAAVGLGYRFKRLADTSLTPAEVPQYRRLMAALYTSKLAALGFDPKPGAHAAEPGSRQALRQSLVPLVALEARDPALRSQLVAAAEAFVAGDANAIDPAYRATALRVAVQTEGLPFAEKLFALYVKSTDPLLRQHAVAGLAAAEQPAVIDAVLKMALQPGVQTLEKVQIVGTLTGAPPSREAAVAFTEANFAKVVEGFPGFARPQIIAIYNGYCSTSDTARIDTFFTTNLKPLGGGDLELSQTKERVGLCAALRTAKGADIAAALAKF